MASNKETPRQRMIGMMYLVLTALLALQVSSAVIDKFQALNKSLEASTSETNHWINKKLKRMDEEVKNRGKRSNEVALMKRANLITERTNKELEYLEILKKELIEKSGGVEADGSLKGAKEETKVEEVMIGANKTGKAYELQKRLQEYVRFMNHESRLNFSMLALNGNEDSLFQNNPEQRNKDFAELNFGQTPLVASLAILSEMQSRIASMQETTINTMAETIGIGDFKFDKLKPVASPAARVVAAGTKYEAKVFMSATSSSLKPEIKVEGKELSVDEAGVGSLTFTASGGNYSQEGYVKKVWKGTIKMKKPDGKDTTYIIEEEYLVAKPGNTGKIRISAGFI